MINNNDPRFLGFDTDSPFTGLPPGPVIEVPVFGRQGRRFIFIDKETIQTLQCTDCEHYYPLERRRYWDMQAEGTVEISVRCVCACAHIQEVDIYAGDDYLPPETKDVSKGR